MAMALAALGTRLAEQVAAGDSKAVEATVKELAARDDYKNDESTKLRLSGTVVLLARLLDASTWSSECVQGALAVIGQCLQVDPPCRDLLAKEGLMKRLARLLDTKERQTALLALRALAPLVKAKNEQELLSEAFKLGAVGKLLRWLDPRPEFEEVARAVGRVLLIISNSAAYRESLRDMGFIPSLITLGHAYPTDHKCSFLGPLYNLARSESLHTSLKDLDLLDLCAAVLTGQPEGAVAEEVKVVVLIATAHVYGGEETGGGGGAAAGAKAAGGSAAAAAAAATALSSAARAEALLNSTNPSAVLLELLDTTVRGDGSGKLGLWDVEEVLHGVQSLARSGQQALAMAQGGVLDLLVEWLAARTDAGGGEGGGGGGSEGDAVVRATRALLNFSMHTAVHPLLHKAGAVEVLAGFEAAADLRVADAARGCLLNLQQLGDAAATAAAGALTGDEADLSVEYDVFLSHKRSDAKDFARAMYNLLVLRGFATFLDYEFREELTDLTKIVRRCHNLVFVLTDNIFDSPWCMMELTAAVEAGVNVILVVKEGSRWPDGNGQKVCDFPSYDTINKLPEAVRSVFTRKALTHSDEYYQAFVDLLLSKIVRPAPPAPPPEPAAGNGGSVAAAAAAAGPKAPGGGQRPTAAAAANGGNGVTAPAPHPAQRQQNHAAMPAEQQQQQQHSLPPHSPGASLLAPLSPVTQQQQLQQPQQQSFLAAGYGGFNGQQQLPMHGGMALPYMHAAGLYGGPYGGLLPSPAVLQQQQQQAAVSQDQLLNEMLQLRRELHSSLHHFQVEVLQHLREATGGFAREIGQLRSELAAVTHAVQQGSRDALHGLSDVNHALGGVQAGLRALGSGLAAHDAAAAAAAQVPAAAMGYGMAAAPYWSSGGGSGGGFGGGAGGGDRLPLLVAGAGVGGRGRQQQRQQHQQAKGHRSQPMMMSAEEL
ncbi:hypothetical protein CHLRE_06g278186v5 [Chlamydomonas reinhardtii]|uniref:TIR domain-containing protein n=1 Tax=Chlamydomonas reinhardtii TaxID=3055 RepID=A0A2K3DP27_CHLRE|nr:uncharacterized protein CHLRE_06g278186v5 [Chlamydomonas reinhardtii]PNW82296.1 hypothetical protein CHLRE_06g278186v5 [Chlamydomonas reinhardtii]